MEKLKLRTPDRAEENFLKLAALFPNAVTEAIKENGEVVRAIDADILRQEISAAVVEGAQERYQFTWPDKRKSVVLANRPIAKTLRLDREKSVGRDGTPGSIDTENIYIEGDNLDALKLLQETYLGKVKLIYIDPPYNTGNDFIYEDDFSREAGEYLADSGQFDEEGNRLVQNTESNGRFHTDWLNMIYPRLRIAKDLLTDDGLFFVSIDEHEIDNCLKILDDIFGRANRIGVIVIKSNPRGSMAIGKIANLHEYLAVYGKNALNADIIGHKLTDEMEMEYKYSDGKGNYRLLGLRMRGGFWRRSDRPNLFFPIYVNPQNGLVSLQKDPFFTEEALPIQPSTMEEGTWRWSSDTISENINLLIAKLVKRGNSAVWDIYQKDYYAREGGRRTKAKSIWDASEINYQNGATEIKFLLGSNIFDYSKPVYLLSLILKMIKFEKNDIVMDFFSGSATTAHAVMQLNAEDGGHRKFILIQLPEGTGEKTEARKAGYKTICEIGQERIRRAGKKIKAETGADIDYGFRVFKVDSSNMEDVYYRPADYAQDKMSIFADNIKPGRTPEDLLFQVMLDLGILLSSPIEETEIAGKKVFDLANGYLMACFDSNVTGETVKAIAQRQPAYAVFRDSGMAGDSVLTNFEQIFETYSPKTRRKVL